MYTHLEQRDSTRPPVSLATLDRMKRERREDRLHHLLRRELRRAVRRRRRRPGAGGRFAGHGAAGSRHHRAGHHGRHRLSLQSRGARTAPAVPGGRPAVRELPVARTSRWPTPCGSCRRAAREMVKLESGAGQLEIVEFLARHDIAVCAHLGLKPQSVHKTGGFRVQGRDEAAARAHARERARRWNPRARTSCCSSAFRRSSARRSPRRWKCRSSASAPARTPTARSWCCTTCSTSPPAASRAS